LFSSSSSPFKAVQTKQWNGGVTYRKRSPEFGLLCAPSVALLTVNWITSAEVGGGGTQIMRITSGCERSVLLAERCMWATLRWHVVTAWWKIEYSVLWMSYQDVSVLCYQSITYVQIGTYTGFMKSLTSPCELRFFGRYRDSLRARRSGGRIAVGVRFFAAIQTGPVLLNADRRTEGSLGKVLRFRANVTKLVVGSTGSYKSNKYQISRKCIQWKPSWYMWTNGRAGVMTPIGTFHE
jgi:hypothetical protein